MDDCLVTGPFRGGGLWLEPGGKAAPGSGVLSWGTAGREASAQVSSRMLYLCYGPSGEEVLPVALSRVCLYTLWVSGGNMTFTRAFPRVLRCAGQSLAVLLQSRWSGKTDRVWDRRLNNLYALTFGCISLWPSTGMWVILACVQHHFVALHKTVKFTAEHFADSCCSALCNFPLSFSFDLICLPLTLTLSLCYLQLFWSTLAQFSGF